MSHAGFDQITTVQAHSAKTDRKPRTPIVHAYPYDSQIALCGAKQKDDPSPSPTATCCLICAELATHKAFITR